MIRPGKIMMGQKDKENMRNGMKKMKDAVIDAVSDALSYPARRKAQKAMIKADEDVSDLKMVREAKGSEPVPNDYRSELFRARANVAVMKSKNKVAQVKALKESK